MNMFKKWLYSLKRWYEVVMCSHNWVPKSSCKAFKEDDNKLFICTICGEEE